MRKKKEAKWEREKAEIKVGCYKRESTILKAIEEVKQKEPRTKYYKWNI